MRFLSVILVVLIVAVSAGASMAQQPPAFTYYRLPEPNDTSVSRAHAVSVDASGTVLVCGEARVESVLLAGVWRNQQPYDAHAPGIFAVLPTPDPSLASKAVDCGCRPVALISPKVCGDWSGGPGGGTLPIDWYDNTENDSMDYQYLLLPTIGGNGSGAGCGVASYADEKNPTPVGQLGNSAPPGGVQEAVAWIADSVEGPYTLEGVGDYGLSYPSQAAGGIVCVDSTVLAGGWAVTPMGLTLPQEWLRDTLGTWTRTDMPLAVGTVEGWVNSLWYNDVYDEVNPGLFCSAGCCSDSFGGKHATLWTKTDNISPWVAEDLGTVAGYVFSEAEGGIDADEWMPAYADMMVGTSYTGGDSVATLWMRDSTGTVTVHDLNDLVVNTGSLDLSLCIATDIDVGGPESLIVITGWGVEMGRGGTDPHAFLLIEEPEAASIRCKDVTPRSLNIVTAPNPFSSRVTASYAVGHSMPIRLAVYDVEGRLVRILADGLQAAGDHAATWDGLDSRGHRAGSGIYFLRLEAGNQAVTRKAVFLR